MNAQVNPPASNKKFNALSSAVLRFLARPSRKFPRQRRVWRVCAFVALLFWGYPSLAQQVDSVNASIDGAALERIQVLIEGGAYELAERLLIKQRPPFSDIDAWMAWENHLWNYYQQRRQWERMLERFDNLPRGLPEPIRNGLHTRAVRAHLQLRDGEGARHLLTRLLWRHNSSAEERSIWRRLMVRSYLQQDRMIDAQLALANYRAEYLPSDGAWQYLFATTMLKAGLPTAVTNELSALQTPEARSLTLLSRLRAQMLTPNRVIELGLKTVEKAEADSTELRDAWLIVAEAALNAKNAPTRVRAIEQVLLNPGSSVLQNLVNVSAEDLVSAYVELAETSGKAAKLVVGDDVRWITRANALAKGFPVAARSLYAFLVKNGTQGQSIDRAHIGLVQSLLKSDMQRILFQLYGENGVLAAFGDLPEPAAVSLSDLALKEGNVRRAAALTKHIIDAPRGISQRDWQLRQARMAIFAGEFERAVRDIQQWVNQATTLDPVTADRMMQLLFDLQSVGQHEAALDLLVRTQPLLVSPQQQREVIFWQADSLKALSRYDEAAEYYLRSAVTNGDSSDLWGQSCRYRAAEAMTKAGLVTDARSVYQALLKITQEPSRRADIQKQIQELWLLEAGEDSLDNEQTGV